MRSAKAVIGAGLGDEGKGLFTDFKASQHDEALVVRYCGGAQAGHTVQLPEGFRHVFHHLASGTLADSRTFLSRFFIVNPLLFSKEFDTLAEYLKYVPAIYVDPSAPVTTPYDILLNQLLEQERGDFKHGSCGVGINETVTRHEVLPLTVKDLLQIEIVARKLDQIRYDYFHRRLADLKMCRPNIVSGMSTDFLLKSDSVVDNFLLQVEKFLDYTEIRNTQEIPTLPIIFEGAQGLMLDERHYYFPYVSRSKTGVDNILELCSELDISKLHVTFVSRCYTTRHGRGPLLHEVPDKPYPGIVDETNGYNKHQENIRFGYFDATMLRYSIRNELIKMGLNEFDVQCTYEVAISCLDQISDQIIYYKEGEKLFARPMDFMKDLQYYFDNNQMLSSHGPTRKDVRFYY